MAGSGMHDFDFLMGSWRVAHRRLAERLTGCETWEEFDGTNTAWPLLGGQGNVDDNVLHLPGGTYRAASIRCFDPASGTWSIWWLDARSPLALDTPVRGRFENGTGIFLAEDTLRGNPIRVRFMWTGTGTSVPRWQQAFSPDAGATWETNWVMAFTRAA